LKTPIVKYLFRLPLDMAWELLVDDDRGTGVFICNTADVAFGPLINMSGSDVSQFYEWWNEVIGSHNDPRTMANHDLSDAIYRWYGIQYENKFQITIPDSDWENASEALSKKVFTGEYYPVDYCSIKGIYDDDITEEDHEHWSMEDWDNIMCSIMKSRECDMDGFDGQMSGYLFPSKTWDDEKNEYVMDKIQRGPKWEIIGIRNGSERVGYSTWTTWDWYKDGEKVGSGDKPPWEVKEHKD